jgi:hypothetical protein
MNLRVGMIVFCFVLGVRAAAASPCAQLKQPDAWVVAKVDALVAAARAAYGRDEAEAAFGRTVVGINDTIRQCKLAQDEKFVDRYREFLGYVEAASLDQSPDHELGFVVPDEQYFAETRGYVQIPAFLLDPVFLRNVSRSETLDRAKSFLRQLNSKRAPADQLIFFSYTSRHLGTPDNDDSYRRLLIVVPGDAARGVPDKWVQFGVTDPGVRVRTRNVSVVSALVAGDGTFNAYFKDFYRTYRRDGSMTIKGRWELGEGDDNCVKCHKSGVLPIFPEAGTVSANEREALAAVNERFITYGSPRFDKYLDATKFGPGIGSPSWWGREQHSANDSHTTVASSETNVASSATSCAICHQPQKLGALNYPMDRIIISSYVEGGQMPYGFDLKAGERAALYAQLIRDYFATDNARPGVLKSWLLGKVR